MSNHLFVAALHLGRTDLGIISVGLLGFLILYLAYKFGWPRDYGLPVRRRLFMKSMRIERDRVAYVPFWWSDVQVQRAVRAYWKDSLRLGFREPEDSQADASSTVPPLDS